MITSGSSSMANTIAPFALPAQPVSPETDKVNLASTFKPVQSAPSVSVAINLPASPSPVYSFGNFASAQPVIVAPALVARNEPSDQAPVPSVTSDAGSDSDVPNNPSSDGSDVRADVTQRPVTGAPVAENESNQPSVPASESNGDNEGGASRTDVNADSAAQAQEAEIIRELQTRDREVRQHEAQHKGVGGQYAGAISYTYQSGPNGQQYAVGGEVDISVSEVPGNPQATIEKMQTVRAAALAPAEPSSQDRAVAAAATRMILSAQQTLVQEREDARVAQARQQEEARVARQEVKESSNDASAEIQTYKNFLELGRRLDEGLVPEINLDEVV